MTLSPQVQAPVFCQDESVYECVEKLVADGVTHRHGEHRAELQRPQLLVRKTLHGEAGVW